MLKKLWHLATALANESDDIHMRSGSARNRTKQRALADSRSREDAHALTLADGEHRVNRAYTSGKRITHDATRKWTRARRPHRLRATRRDRTFAIDRSTERINDATEPLIADTHRCIRLLRDDSHATRHAISFAQQHHQRTRTIKANNFAARRISAMRHMHAHQ